MLIYHSYPTQNARHHVVEGCRSLRAHLADRDQHTDVGDGAHAAHKHAQSGGRIDIPVLRMGVRVEHAHNRQPQHNCTASWARPAVETPRPAGTPCHTASACTTARHRGGCICQLEYLVIWRLHAHHSLSSKWAHLPAIARSHSINVLLLYGTWLSCLSR